MATWLPAAADAAAGGASVGAPPEGSDTGSPIGKPHASIATTNWLSALTGAAIAEARMKRRGEGK